MTRAPIPQSVPEILQQISRPSRAVVTAGMPYANGPLHLGHLAGAHIPADIYARYLKMLLGPDRVLFVCGTDEHGSASEIAAMNAGTPIRDFVDGIHDRQAQTLRRYAIGLDVYSGTSRPDCLPLQTQLAHDFLRGLQRHGMLEKRTSLQWYDPKLQRFLPDRFVRGKCPNPKCDNTEAHGDECDRCNQPYEPRQLLEPRSVLSGAVPELRPSVHWYLDMWKVAEPLRQLVQSKKQVWRTSVLSLALEYLLPSQRVPREYEQDYRARKASLPPHRQKYARGGELTLQFDDRASFETARSVLQQAGIPSTPVSEWAYRSITRDTSWGIPLPDDVDPELAGRTVYVWPDSLIAPISFTKLALAARGESPEKYREFWTDPSARVVQFLGQDNVFFYVLMQGAMWLGTQADSQRLPIPGELQFTDIFGCFHLTVGGQKMSKSRGNFYTGDQLLDEKGYDADQLRYYLSLLGLSEKPSDFDFAKLDERNAFLAGPMNAAFERPLSAAHSKFGGKVPAGTLHDKVRDATVRIVQRYVRGMERGEYPGLLFEIETYARQINSLFTQFKPHDDRHPEGARADALFSSFYILKNLAIMLYPFVPSTIERVWSSLNLPRESLRIDELGTGLPAGHAVGTKQVFFPATGRE
ncbi:MAG TPA: class I tRNA ligase family protein [Polyangiales bacterium]|nr:class I tRNA ligase family protein [Polyangiales bacterium]